MTKFSDDRGENENKPDLNPELPREQSELELSGVQWLESRRAFVLQWVEGNQNLSEAGQDYLRKLVFAEDGLWNDNEQIVDVFEPSAQSGVIIICYDHEGFELEIPFRYLEQ